MSTGGPGMRGARFFRGFLHAIPLRCFRVANAFRMEFWHYFLLAGLGVVAGTLNVLAGGGSLLTLPVMVFLGMDGPVANGTNRVAIG